MTMKKIDVYDHLKKCSSNVHTYHFLSIFVQAMSYSIAIALEHNVSFINLNNRQMYLHTNLISLTFSLKHIAIRYAKQRNKII